MAVPQIVGGATAEFSADAETNAGSSTAEAIVETGQKVGFTGISAKRTLDIEGDALLEGTADLNLNANASSTGNSANALAKSADFIQGIEVKGRKALVDISGNAIIEWQFQCRAII